VVTFPRRRKLPVVAPDPVGTLLVSDWARWDFHLRCLRVRLLTQRMRT